MSQKNAVLPGQGQSKKAIKRRAKRNAFKKKSNTNGKTGQTKGKVFSAHAVSSDGKKVVLSRANLTDPRFSAKTTDLTTSQSNSSSNPTLINQVLLSTESLSGIGLAVVSFVLSRGFQVSSVSINDAFQAWLYIAGIFQAYANNSVPEAITVPKWMAVIGQALMSKQNVLFRSGKSTYQWNVIGPDTTLLTNSIQIGPTSYGYEYRFSNPAGPGVTVNNLWIQAIPVSSVYNQTAAEQAWTQVLQFLQNITSSPNDPRAAMHKLVATNKVNKFTNDPSAFADIITSPGGGFGSTGGWGNMVHSEVPIRTPLLAVFNVPVNVSDVEDPARYPAFIRNVNGDMVSSTGQLIHLLHPSQITKKAPTFFKFIDFNEFFEVMLYYIQGLIDQAVNRDPENVLNEIAGGINLDFARFTVPMTMQNFRLMLRAVLMNTFKDTQFLGQSLYPRPAANNSDNQFISFICAPNCCPYPGVTEMSLPNLLVENLRDLTMRSNTGGLAGERNPTLWLPVLGEYNLDKFNTRDWVVQVNQSTIVQTIPLFAPDQFRGQLIKDKKTGAPSYPLTPEIPISDVDGGANDGGPVLVQINDPGVLNSLIATWNEWLQGMSQYSIPLTELGTDSGISSLLMTNVTRHWNDVQLDEVEVLSKRYHVGMKIRQEVFNSPYNFRQILAVTSHDEFYASAWETIQQMWIAPINKSDFTPGKIQTYTSLPRVKTLLCEPHQVTLAATLAPYTLNTLHFKYGTVMVRQSKSPMPDYVKFLETEAAKGRGGILSMIGAGLDAVLGGI